MDWEEIAKINDGKEISDQDFAKGLGLYFYVEDGGSDKGLPYIRKSKSEVFDPVVDFDGVVKIAQCLWAQLRHAYGFQTPGSCNSKHFAQILSKENPNDLSHNPLTSSEFAALAKKDGES